jgi:hypothetical protein
MSLAESAFPCAIGLYRRNRFYRRGGVSEISDVNGLRGIPASAPHKLRNLERFCGG